MDDITNPTSRFNEANLNIMRLHQCWIRCSNFRSKAMYNEWKWELDNVWSELCQDVIEERLSNYDEVERINEELKKSIGIAKNRDELYKLLDKRQIFLRRLQERVGKGGVWTDGTEEHFD